MEKVLYIKYNPMRKPQFRIRTGIVEENGERYVRKDPMLAQALSGIRQIRENYQKAVRLYRSIRVLPYTEDGTGLKFDYLHGSPLVNLSDFPQGSEKEMVKKIAEILDVIYDFNPECVRERFRLSEEFRRVFPDCFPREEESVIHANADGTLDNFMQVRDEIWCMDYEWFFGFEVPVRFLKYRTLFYFYIQKEAYLGEIFDLSQFLSAFGYSSDDMELFHRMEECFQQYVHGEDRKYIYTKNYEKYRTSLPLLKRQMEMKDTHIANLECQLREREREIREKDRLLTERGKSIQRLSVLARKQELYISDIRRAMKDPVFAFGLVKGKMIRSIRDRKKTGDVQPDTGLCLGDLDTGSALWMEPEYERWITQVEAMEKQNQVFAYNPKISVLVPVYNVLDEHLVPCIESVIAQTYENWELCLADDCSEWENVRITLQRYEQKEAVRGKIKVAYREKNGHISECTNTALKLADGEFIAFLDCDDLLRPNALYEVVKKLNEDRSLDFIYSDEDKVDENGNHRHMPFFKPDWSPDTFLASMYTCHLGVYRRSIANEIGGLRKGYEGAQDYDFALRFTERTDRIAHIPKILYHWREREESTSVNPQAKPYIYEATKKSKEDALARRGWKARLKGRQTQFCVDYIPSGRPLVSIIIPSKDNPLILQRCLVSLTEKTTYKNYEIVLIDNGSSEENKEIYSGMAQQYSVRYIYQKMEFNFSKMCNIGAARAKGSYYLFLNDDVEIIQPEWLESMLGQAQLEHTGAVGAKLLYPESGLIQHVGVINIDNGPVHCLAGYSDEFGYYFGRNTMTYNVIAVTGACLLIQAGKFKEAGRFNEELPVAYNDVDLCFRLYEAGYYNVVRNDIVLYHHESVSRGDDLKNQEKTKRLLKEQKHLYALHPALERKDPFYSIMLVQNGEDFSYNYGFREDCV